MQKLMWHDLQMILRRAPAPVIEMMKTHGSKVFCAGGFIRTVVAGEPASDIDLFCTSKDIAEVLAKELHKKMGGNKKDWFESSYAYTVFIRPRMPVQFIHRWTFETPEQCIASFDYTIACAAFWWDGTNGNGWMTTCADRFYADLAGHRLVYLSPVRNEDAGGSILRALKFYQKGYRIPLDSFAAVIARLMQGVDVKKIGYGHTANMENVLDEERLAHVLLGLLREVDPNLSQDHIAYLPAEDVVEEKPEESSAAGAGSNG